MKYTIRNVPAALDQTLRQRAREHGRSLNEVALDALLTGVGLWDTPIQHRDLMDVSGTWVDDPEVDEALADQRRIERPRVG
jgi:plasmid stability protein